MENRHMRPQDRYNQAHTKKYAFRFMLTTEADLIEKLESVPNKAGYIKSLIRADIAREKGENHESF